MTYIIKVKPKYGGREKAYPVIFETRDKAMKHIDRIRTQFNDYQIVLGI